MSIFCVEGDDGCNPERGHVPGCPRYNEETGGKPATSKLDDHVSKSMVADVKSTLENLEMRARAWVGEFQELPKVEQLELARRLDLLNVKTLIESLEDG